MKYKEIRELIDYIATDFPTPIYTHENKDFQRKIRAQLKNKHIRRRMVIGHIRLTLAQWKEFGSYGNLLDTWLKNEPLLRMSQVNGFTIVSKSN